MQLGMTLQYHALEHVLGDTNVEKLFQTAVRLCIVGDEVWMQSSLLHLEALLAKARAGFPPALIEAGNRYRMLVAMPGAAWLRWGGALGVNLPNAMLDAYNRRALPRAATSATPAAPPPLLDRRLDPIAATPSAVLRARARGWLP